MLVLVLNVTVDCCTWQKYWPSGHSNKCAQSGVYCEVAFVKKPLQKGEDQKFTSNRHRTQSGDYLTATHVLLY